MNKFIIDQILFLVIGICIIVLIPVFCGPVFALVFQIVGIVCWGYLCRRILLLPIDLVLGKVTHSACFISQCSVQDLEFFKKVYCCEWKFRTENGHTLKLLVPTAIKDESNKFVVPQKNVMYRITFFRLSKILLVWDETNQG